MRPGRASNKSSLRLCVPSCRPGRRQGGGQGLTDPTVIREIQERLYNLNYDISVLNGQLTEETRSAIRDWQKNTKHEPTGELTQDELAELRNVRLPSTWGALAYAARGASAVVWNRPSRQEAVSAALTDCRSRAGRDNCKVVTDEQHREAVLRLQPRQ